MVGAGADNQAVGLDIKTASTTTKPTALGDSWEATDAQTVPPFQGPSLKLGKAKVDSNQITIHPNEFEQAINEAKCWYSNMSYGIKTKQGVIGMTWSPSQTRTLTPITQFFISVGSFSSNKLASWTTVSNTSAMLTTGRNGSFDILNNATVTRGSNDRFTATPGASDISRKLARRGVAVPSLVESHQLLTRAHAQLVASSEDPARDAPAEALVAAADDDIQNDVIISLGDLLKRHASEARFVTVAARVLAKVALANYFAGAMLMPYAAFHQAARDEHYDIDVLGRRLGSASSRSATG